MPADTLLPEDRKRIQDFYAGLLAKNGTESAQSLNWTNKRNQLVRFEALLRIGDLAGRTVLDVGSGLGDLYPWVAERGGTYRGIELVPELLAEARTKYPAGDFRGDDLFAIDQPFDYVIASGSLSFMVADNDAFYESMIRKMYTLAAIAVGFNMLDSGYYERDAIYASYDPGEIADICERFAQRTYVVSGYTPGDFTVFLYKDPDGSFLRK